MSTNTAVITRVFEAPREAVWAAVTEPEHFAAWFGHEPFETPVERVEMDVRPGGIFRAAMVNEREGIEQPFVGRYLEVVPRERLVQTLANPADPDDPNVETLTYTLRDAPGGTELTYHQTGHLPPEQYPLIEQGVAGFFDRLAQHLAS
ncbi:MAG TPA: SRPBCC domain-containing protein [Gaiellaceae bacterium]|nr:SRPBCC domain-containing protein [Gaiellaceae bacterium]